MKIKTSSLHSLKWSAIGNWGSQILSFVIFTILARLLKPESFGLVAMVQIFIMFVEMFVTQGFGMAIIQRKELEPELLNTAFWFNVLLSLGLAAASVAASGPISLLLGSPDIRPFIIASSACFFFSGLSVVQSAILTREMRFDSLSKRRLIAQTSGGVVGIAMALTGAGTWSLVCQTLTTYVVGCAVVWTACDWRPSTKVASKHLGELWSYSWAVLGGNILSFISTRADQYLVGRAIGTVSLAYYSIGQKTVNLLGLGVTAPISSISVPAIAKSQDDKSKISGSIRHGIEMASLFCIPLYVILICLPRDAISAIFGDRWIDAAPILAILMIGEIANLIVVFNKPVFFSLKKPEYNLWTLLAKALGAVAATLIGMRWGMAGIAVGIVINTFVNSAISCVFVAKLLPVTLWDICAPAIRPLGCSIFMAAAIIGIRSLLPADANALVAFLACSAAGAAAYIGAVALVARKSLKEGLEYVRTLVKGNKEKSAEFPPDNTAAT